MLRVVLFKAGEDLTGGWKEGSVSAVLLYFLLQAELTLFALQVKHFLQTLRSRRLCVEGAIFSTFAHLMSLCHVLEIFTLFLTFSLSCYGDQGL